MGRPMALNMLKSGGKLVVYVRKPEGFRDFEEKGAIVTTELSDLAATDILFLCLPNSGVVKNLLFGRDGLADGLHSGQIVVDFGTSKFNETTEIAQRLAEKQISFLDAPISGMTARAAEGTLTVMCGGERSAFEIVRPFFTCVGNKILYMGGTGTGQMTKLINQLLFDINMAALAEVLPLAVKMGLDPQDVEQVINSGTGRSYASEFFVPRILKNNFSEGYSLKNAYKDLVSAAELSAEQGIPLPVLHAATTTYQMALLEGHGDSDKGAMIRVFEKLLGVEYRNRK
jgi:3-hydroxyisobutyrate dehydrogenase-like beta-hydroxyacid dehydrogenase